ncbi:MAG: pyridoxal 5'-phosphate synthase glutaminase subunit PdxT [Acidimicrobiia bacterium]
MRVGVLALQGDFREHLRMLDLIGVATAEVRTPEELAGVDALVIPGGESTTIGKLADGLGLIDAIRSRCDEGMPVFGTCAGMIFLASGTVGFDQPQVGVLDATVQRNAFGRQVESFEVDLAVEGLDESMHAVFIRAPWIEKVGGSVDVLAATPGPDGADHPVVVKQGRILASSFHPELTSDTRLHRMFIDMIDEA